MKRGPCRDWSTGEVAKLVWLRTAGASVKSCAERLCRSPQSVRQQLHRQAVIVQPHYERDTIRRLVQGYVRRGNTDAWIALKLGRGRDTIRYLRRELKLKANRRGFWDRARAARCIGCDVLCPISFGRGWLAVCGWRARVVAGSPSEREYHCPTCFTRWGWGDMDIDDAKNLIANGVEFGAVYESVSEPERDELKEWYVREPGLPNVAARKRSTGPATGTATVCARCGGLMVRTGTCETCQDCGDNGGCG